MSGRSIVTAAGLVALFALAVGLPALLVLRFSGGDTYPPYSSLRSDPLGARALFDGLDRSGLHRVSRAFQPPEEMDLDPDTALLYLGDTLPPHDLHVFSASDTAALSLEIRSGVRAVIALLPRNVAPGKTGTNATRKAEARSCCGPDSGSDEDCDKKKPDRETARAGKGEPAKLVSLREWLDVGLTDVPVIGTQTVFLADELAAHALPTSLLCRTSICFTNVGPEWTPIYLRGKSPVMIERRIGKGSIVLSSLSFFVSNEALRADPQPTLIAWLIGGKRNVLFDETHHGVMDAPSLAALLRRHGLLVALTALTILAGLYVWRQSSSLAPPFDDGDIGTPHAVSTQNSLSGLAGLLSRNVPKSDLPRVCFTEWRKTAARHTSHTDPALLMAPVVESPSKSPADDYNRLARILSEHVNTAKRRRQNEPGKTERNTDKSA